MASRERSQCRPHRRLTPPQPRVTMGLLRRQLHRRSHRRRSTSSHERPQGKQHRLPAPPQPQAPSELRHRHPHSRRHRRRSTHSNERYQCRPPRLPAPSQPRATTELLHRRLQRSPPSGRQRRPCHNTSWRYHRPSRRRLQLPPPPGRLRRLHRNKPWRRPAAPWAGPVWLAPTRAATRRARQASPPTHQGAPLAPYECRESSQCRHPLH